MTAGDAQLLHHFHATRDEAAFAELVRRHGPMVLGVCRRILQNHADAEDAFQATFLVLAQKAGTIRETETMAHWLYCVAANASRRLRTQRSSRTRMERRARTLVGTGSGAGRIASIAPEHASDEDRAVRDAVPVLDEEVSRLPERLRAPVVLCYLRGKTYSEAAVELSVGEDTVRGRLARGREMLRSRLARRGVTLSAGALAAVLARNSASAVPAPLLSSTCAAASQLVAAGGLTSAAAAGAVAVAKPQAVALAKQVIVSLMMAHAAPAAIVLTGVLLVGGAGMAIRQAFGNDTGAAPTAAQTSAMTTGGGSAAFAPQPAAPGQNLPPSTPISQAPPAAAPPKEDPLPAPPLAGPVSSLPGPVAEAVSNWRAGTIQRLRPNERSFTLIPDPNAADTQTRRYTLGMGVEIEVDRRRAQFSDLREGQRAYVNDLNGSPLQVRASTPRVEARP